MSDSTSINALIAGQHNASVIDSLANPAQVNVLGSITRAAEAAKSAFGARELAGRQAWNDALAASTDANGQTDYGAAMARMAKSGQLGMGDAATQASPLVNDQLSRAHMLLGMSYGAIGGLPANAKRADVLAVLARLKAAGAPGVDQEIAAVPQNDADVPAYVQQMNLAAGSAMDQFHARVGTPTTIQTPGGVVGTTQAGPQEGGGLRPPSGMAYPLGMSPAEWNAPVQGYVNPANNQPEAITHGQLWERMGLVPKGFGMNPPVPAAVPAQPPAGAPAPAPGAKPPVAPVPGATTAPPVATSTTVPIGPRPDDAAVWKASSDLYTRDKETATNFQQRMFPLAQIYSILASGDVTTGEWAPQFNKARSILETMGAKLGWTDQTSNQAKFDDLTKYMQQYVNSQGMAGRSDQALASAITGNPSAHLSTLANKDVVKPLIAMERMKQMAMQDFENQKGGGHPNDYTKFLGDWQNTHDPRAFMVDMLDKPAYMKMLNGMGTQDRIRFDKTLKLVEGNPNLMSLSIMPH